MNTQTHDTAAAQPQFLSLGGGISDEGKLELLEYWHAVVKRKWAILAATLVAGIISTVIVGSLTPVYSSTVKVLIEQNKTRVLKIEEVYGVSNSRENFLTQAEIIKSTEVARRVASELRLWEHPEFDPRQASPGIRDQIKGFLGIVEPEVEWTEDKLRDHAAGMLSERITVVPVGYTNILSINVEAQDEKLVVQLANSVANAYINADRDARFKVTQQANAWLQERTQSLREALLASERALQDYREKHGLVNLSDSAQTMVGQQISEANSKLFEAKARRIEAEGAYEQVKAIKDGDYLSVPAVMRNPTVVAARQQESAAALKVAELQQRYGAEHVRMVQAQSELKAARESLSKQVQTVVAGMAREYESARATERALEAALNSARGAVQSVNRQEFQLTALQRDVAANKQIFDMFVSRAKETNEESDLQSAVGRVLDPAAIAVLVKPKKAKLILLFIIAGMMLGVVVSVTLDKLDNTVKGIEDAEKRFQQPVLSALPELSAEDSGKSMTLFIEQPQSHLAEAIRTARTGVLLSNIDASSRVIVVTSSVPGEGKTTVCSNLALAHAQTKRTLLIDADMRRPQVGKRLGLPPEARGLSSLVAGTARLEDCIHAITGSQLAVMPVGDIPPNPLELLLSQRFRETLAELASIYEVIIIDTPPVELVSDALVLSPMATGTIFVVRAMETPYPLARKGLVRIQRAGGKMLGVMLNHLDYTKARSYYGEYSGYSQYGYQSYGYESKTQSKA